MENSVNLETAYDQALRKLATLARAFLDAGVEVASFYALSTDNLARSSADLQAVFTATTRYLESYLPNALPAGTASIRVAGRLELLPEPYRRAAERLIASRRSGSFRLYLLIAYSGSSP
jgi:undecaprenyl diphosphate synthase